MTPENLNNNEEIDVMELETETPVSEHDVSNAKIESPAQGEKKGLDTLKEKLSNLFKKKELSPDEQKKQEEVKAEKAKNKKIEEAKDDNMSMTSILSMGAGSPQQAGRISEEMSALSKKWSLGEAGEEVIKKTKEAAEELEKAKKSGETNEKLTALKAAQIEAINEFKRMVMNEASK